MGRGVSILLMLGGAAFGAVAVFLWSPHLDSGLAGVLTSAPLGLVAHLIGAALFAIGGGQLHSRRMVPLFLVFALVLPLLGMLTMVGMSRLLAGGTKSVDAEDELTFGNPILAHSKPGVAPVYLKPIARMMRERDRESIGRMILGLSKGGGAERGFQILRRYQQDPDVELQFYAQNAQLGATEGLELHLKNLSARIVEDSEDASARGAIAEVLIELAGRRATSSSDANAYVRRAFEHLRQLPESSKRAALETRGYLLLREPAGARTALEKLPETDRRHAQLAAELFYAERDWDGLAVCAQQLESSDIQLRTARTFWRQSA